MPGSGVLSSDGKPTLRGLLCGIEPSFSLDAVQGRAVVAGRVVQFNPSYAEIHRNDIYIRSALIAELLPLDVRLDSNFLLITLEAREPLPLQMRLDRERRGAQAKAYLPIKDRGYPRVVISHRDFDGPFIDYTVELERTSHSGTDMRYSALITADLLGMTNETYVYTEKGHAGPKARVTMSRLDPGGKLLGSMGAREVAFGDVNAPSIPLVSRANRATGLLVSNYPLFRPSEFDTHTFQGNAPPGWDIELYRDEVLLDYLPAQPDGRYEFRDVPLLFGLNHFRLVFHGPHGEKREEDQVFNVGSSMLEAGDNAYRLCWNELDDGGSQALLQGDWGLQKDLTIGGALVTADVDGDTEEFVSLAARGYKGQWYGRFDAAFDTEGGSAGILGLQTRLGETTVSLQHTEAGGFVSNVHTNGTYSIRRQTQLRADNIRLHSGRSQFPARLAATRDEYASGLTRTRVSGRISTRNRRVRLSHFLDWQRLSGDGRPHETTMTGTLLASTRKRQQHLRGELTYQLWPSRTLNSAALTSEWYIDRDRSFSAGISRDIHEDRTRFLGSFNRIRGRYSWRLGAQSGTDGSFLMGISVSSFMAHDKRSGRWARHPRKMAGDGALSIRVWLDLNQNGEFDEGDQPLPDVGFFVNSISHEARTVSDGLAFVGGLSPYQPVDVSISLSTLEDPLWVPVAKGARVTPRPGVALPIDFPVVPTGEVGGTAYTITDGLRREAPGIELEIVDAEGEVLQATRTAYDGFYTIPGVPVGEHLLRVSPDQSAKLNLKPAQRALTVPPGGGFVDGVDLLLEYEPQ